MDIEKRRILEAWAEILDSDSYVLGKEGDAFERELGEFVGSSHAIGVSSGTAALELILRTIISTGDEVVVPALTFIATAEAVLAAGGVPVFADVDPETWCLTADSVRPHLTGRSAALVPVHLFGNPAPIDDFRAYGLPVIEDACQAIGSTYHGQRCGSVGIAAAFSFYPSKTLAGCGDGGAITTSDPDIAEAVRLLRHHGSEDGRLHREIGGTHRLDELQAAALRIRLEALPAKVASQRAAAGQLRAEGHRLQRQTEYGASSWHRFVTCSAPRAGGRSYYDPPLHQQPAMRRFWRCALPNAETFARSNVCLTPPSTQPQ